MGKGWKLPPRVGDGRSFDWLNQRAGGFSLEWRVGWLRLDWRVGGLSLDPSVGGLNGRRESSNCPHPGNDSSMEI